MDDDPRGDMDDAPGGDGGVLCILIFCYFQNSSGVLVTQHYTCFFPEQRGSRFHVSAREYYYYLLQIRSGVFVIFFHGGRLFQQWLVDMYIKVESMRLDWHARPENQAIICANLYQVIFNFMVMQWFCEFSGVFSYV